MVLGKKIYINFLFVPDLVGCKLGMSKQPRQHQHQQQYQHHQQQSQSYRLPQHQEVGYYSTSRDSIAYINRAANVSSAASELDLSRKARRRDLRGKLKLPSSVALASSGEAPLLGAWRGTPGSTAGTNPPSSNHLNSNSSCNGTERYVFVFDIPIFDLSHFVPMKFNI